MFKVGKDRGKDSWKTKLKTKLQSYKSHLQVTEPWISSYEDKTSLLKNILMILWSTAYTPETLANEKTVRNKIFNFIKNPRNWKYS